MKHCCNAGVPLKFGKYVKLNEDLDTTNTMKYFTFPGIYLRSYDNIQGTKRVFALKTGVTKKPRSVTPYTMPPNEKSY